MSKEKYAHKKQHFVAACYLKAWLDPDAPATNKRTPYLWMFDKDGRNARNKPPEKIFHETDMYTLRSPDGGRDLRLERGLGEAETNFTRVRTSKFKFRRELSQEDWLWACLFAALAHNRTAASRDHFLGQLEKVKSMFETAAGNEWETQTIEPALPPGVDSSNVYIPQPGDFDNLKESTTEVLLKSAVEVILPELLDMQKTVLCTSDPLGFLTSDAPSTWFDPTAYRRHPLMRSSGLKAPDIEITLPISPEQCLLFTHRPVGPLYLDLTLDGLDVFNHRHRAFAPSAIVTRRNETRLRWFEPGPTPDDSWEAVHPDAADDLSYGSDWPPAG